MTTIEETARMDIAGNSAAYAGRLDWVRGLVDKRLKSLSQVGRSLDLPTWKQVPAYELHIQNGLGTVLADPVAWLTLRYIVAHGEQAHVVVILHEDVEVVRAQLAAASRRLASELNPGRSLRMASGAQASGSGPLTEDPYGVPARVSEQPREDEQVPVDPSPVAPFPTRPATEEGGSPGGDNEG